MIKSVPPADADVPSDAPVHPLVEQLRDMLATPSQTNLGALATVVQQLYAEMKIVGGAVRGEPDANGGSAPADAVEHSLIDRPGDRPLGHIDHTLHTFEHYMTDRDLPI